MKDVEVLIDDLPQTNTLVGELRLGRIHVTVRVANRLRVVMSAQRFVITKPDRN